MEPVERSANPDKELKERLEALGPDGKKGSPTEIKELLDFLQNNQMRKPLLVVKYGKRLIDNYPGTLGDDVWEMREKVLIAALDADEKKTAEQMLQELDRQFGRSTKPSLRLERLRATYHEACGNWQSAENIYKNVIMREDTVNPHAIRRIACCYKGQGNMEGAVQWLNKYLRIFPADVMGWIELAEMYVSLDRVDYAKFCYEEAILIEPQNYLYPLLYADSLYALGSQKKKHGGVKNPYDVARQYYIQALELAPGNLRALLGLAMCLRALKVTSHTASLFEWVDSEITRVYSKSGAEARATLKIVRAALRQ